ncbi:hypothetical protein PXNS11_60199 [Stutzerimonas xanthomarina]|nr:hypothetical protein PXNS11_60199 [Stutzerimonas xanthomarina]
MLRVNSPLLTGPGAKGTTVLDGVMHIPRAERGRDPERAVFAASVVLVWRLDRTKASARMLVNRE